MAAPELTSLNPSTVDISNGEMVDVTLTGTGFTDTSVVTVNGSDDNSVFVSATEITLGINTYTASGPSTLQIAVKNGADASAALPLELTGVPVGDNPGYMPDTPPEGASPNTPAVRAEYLPPDPPDVYQQGPSAPIQFMAATKTGEPSEHEDPEELPTTNAHEDGGLPTNPREPYPTGNGPENAGEIKGA